MHLSIALPHLALTQSSQVSPLDAREEIQDGSVMIYKVNPAPYFNATGTIGDQR